MSREAMQMALETAEQIACADYRHWEDLASLSEFERWARSRANHIAEALRARLSQCERCGEVNPAEIHTCTPKHEPAECDGGQCGIGGYCKQCPKTQPEPEPVAWMYNGNLHEFDPSDWAEGEVTPLYTAPPQRECVSCAGLCCQDYEKCNLPCTPRGREQARREWQGLTDEEVFAALVAVDGNTKRLAPGFVAFYCAIEAALKAKNG